MDEAFWYPCGDAAALGGELQNCSPTTRAGSRYARAPMRSAVSQREILGLIPVTDGRSRGPNDCNRRCRLGAIPATQTRFQARKHKSPL